MAAPWLNFPVWMRLTQWFMYIVCLAAVIARAETARNRITQEISIRKHLAGNGGNSVDGSIHSGYSPKGTDTASKEANYQHFKFLQFGGILKMLQGTDFRGTVGNVLSGAVSATDPCLGQSMNTGYLNDAEDDYPYQPSCYGAGASNTISCFPGSALVRTPTGTIPMNRLTVGTQVATGIESRDGKVFLRYEPVLFFLHKDVTARAQPWITIHWKRFANQTDLMDERGSSSAASTRGAEYTTQGVLVVSPYHLIYASQPSSLTTGVSEKAFHSPFTYVAAKRLKVGDQVLMSSFEGAERERNGASRSPLSLAQITRLQEAASWDSAAPATRHTLFFEEGLYAPATASGTLLVDGVITSQFSSAAWMPASFDHQLHFLALVLVRPFVWFTSWLQMKTPALFAVKATTWIEALLTQTRLAVQHLVDQFHYVPFRRLSYPP